MSGHSHWHTIKFKKGLADSKRGQIFSKLARQITIAVRESGDNPENNSKLRVAIEEAKSFNMPSENVERARKKGTGELGEGGRLEPFVFEAYGPGGIAVIIEGISDNKNRALSEIKHILSLHEGKLAAEGSVNWMFEKRGVITIDFSSQKIQQKEQLEDIAIEAGADDLYRHEDCLDVYTKLQELGAVKKKLEEKGLIIEQASPDLVAKNLIAVSGESKENLQKLFEDLDENEAVQEIYSNAQL